MTNLQKFPTTFLNKNKPLILLGDFHGEWRLLFSFLDKNKISNCYLLCVGDVGIGFPGGMSGDFIIYNKYFKEMEIEFLSIRGNHDDPKFFDGSVNLSNFQLLEDYSILNYRGEIWQLVGGAISVDRFDKKTRVLGYSYWKDEVFNLIPEKAIKCDVLVTHTCPNWIGPGLKGEFIKGCLQADPSLRGELIEERRLLDCLFDICKPKKAFFGHFHTSETIFYENQKYSCLGRILDILEFYEYRNENKKIWPI